MHTIQNNHRVTSYMNSVGRDRNCGAARNIRINISSVDVVNGIVVESPDLLGETISMGVRHDVAVFSPNVSQVRIDRVILVKISGNRNLGTLTNLISCVHTINSNNRLDSRRIEDMSSGTARSCTTRCGLSHLNSDYSIINRNRSGESTLGAISNRNIVDIPLIG